MKLSKLTHAAILAALTCIATLLIPVPLPGGGYANAGDIVILLGAFLLGPAYGAAAAGIGAGFADIFLGYTAYAPGTLIIKAADAVAAALIYRACRGHMKPALAMVLAGVAGEAVMVIGYFGYEALILQNGLAAAVGMVPNMLQGAVGVVGAAVLMLALGKHLAGENKGV